MYNPNSKSVGSRITNNMLPRVEDRFSFLYIEYARIIQDEFSIAACQKNKKTIIPLAMVNVLLLGPGTSISHAAMKNIADAGCTAIWCGHDIKYIYSTSMVSSEYSKNLIIQAKCYSDVNKHTDVVRRMYQLRYPNVNMEKFSLQQMRGTEGKRVKERYRELAGQYGVDWDGREYDQDEWDSSNDVNRFLSMGNSLLYGICQAAIIAFGMSPGLGFIHNGGSRSFVFDIADLYKEEFIFPVAFRLAAEHGNDDDMRAACREMFVNGKLMKRIAKNFSTLFQFDDINAKTPVDVGLWNLDDCVELGVNYSK